MATKNQDADRESSAPKDGKPPTLFVGIDLGTSRTAIAASNGERRDVFSCVGKPKDEVSVKLLGKRLLFGREAIEHRMALDFHRPLEKGVIATASDAEKETNLWVVRALLEHAVSLVSPKPDDVIYGVVGAPARASLENKRMIIDATRGILNGVMVTSEPFAVAYGIDVLDGALIVDIGAGTMDLCRMHGTFPSEEDQMTISKAGDFIDRELFDALEKKYPAAQFSMNMIKAIKERYGYVADRDGTITVELPVEGRPRSFDITAELRASCLKIVPDLIAAVQRLIGSFDPEFQSKLRNNVIVCGGGSQMQGLRKLIETGLTELGGGRVTLVDEPVYAGANGALKIAREMPADYWELLGA